MALMIIESSISMAMMVIIVETVMAMYLGLCLLCADGGENTLLNKL